MAEPSRIAKAAEPVLLPYQVRWLADQAPVKVVEKSRRIGLTWAEAADSVLCASTTRGLDTWYLGYNQDMTREFIETAAEWARHLEKAAHAIEEIVLEDERRDLQAYRIRFRSGNKIVALSSRPSNLRGKQGRAVIDEAAFHDDLPALLKAALAFTLWGGSVRIISTHNGVDSAFNELVNDIRAGRKNYSLHRITLDDALADGLYHRICQKQKLDWTAAGEAQWRADIFAQYGVDADEELLCIPRSSGGAYLPSVLIEDRMVAGTPVARWAMPADFARESDALRARSAADFCAEHIAPALAGLDPEAMSFIGEDFGRSGDLTVIWPLQLTRKVCRHTPFVVELRNIPFKQQEEILFYIIDHLPRFTAGAMDARGNGQYLAERAMQRYGAKIRQVMLTIDWYRDNMPRYKAAFEDAATDLPRDAAILADHRSLVVDQGVARISERRGHDIDGSGRHGDSVIAAALAYFASQLTVSEYSYTGVPRTPTGLRIETLTPDTDPSVGRSGRFSRIGAW